MRPLDGLLSMFFWQVDQHWAMPTSVFGKVVFPWKDPMDSRIYTLEQAKIITLVKPSRPSDIIAKMLTRNFAKVAEKIVQHSFVKFACRERLFFFNIEGYIVDQDAGEFRLKAK